MLNSQQRPLDLLIDLIGCVQMAERQRWFFGLPKDVKQRIKRTSSNSRGWFDDEFTKQKLDWKEGLDIGVDGKTDVIDGTNQWLMSSGPAGSPDPDAEAEAFKAVTIEYFEAMTGKKPPDQSPPCSPMSTPIAR